MTKKIPPSENFMGANCNVTPQLKKNFYYRFDLTKKTPPVKILWVQTNVTPQLKKIFYYIFDFTKKTPPVKILWVQTVMLHLN